MFCCDNLWLVGNWSLTSVVSTNTAISATSDNLWKSTVIALEKLGKLGEVLFSYFVATLAMTLTPMKSNTLSGLLIRRQSAHLRWSAASAMTVRRHNGWRDEHARSTCIITASRPWYLVAGGSSTGVEVAAGGLSRPICRYVNTSARMRRSFFIASDVDLLCGVYSSRFDRRSRDAVKQLSRVML